MSRFPKEPESPVPKMYDPYANSTIRVDTGTNNPFINEEAMNTAEEIMRSQRPKE